MKITVAQIRLKTADFKFNLDNIVKNINSDCDLIVFPQIDIEELGGKDLVFDENCMSAQAKLYKDIAEKNYKQNIIIGDILIRNGEVEVSDYGIFDICGNKVYVSDTFEEDVECDLYILAKNRYYAMNTYNEFVESIDAHCDFIYVNALGIADENVFAGGSFAKNSDNKIVMQMPLCKEDIDTVDFSRVIEFNEEPVESQVVDVTTFALKEYCENTQKTVTIYSVNREKTENKLLLQ